MSNNPKQDVETARFLKLEAKRQKETINLIAAENYASRAVLEAQGSILTNKYAEGYPQHRYYAGCPNIDAIEGLAIERAEKLFNAEHAEFAEENFDKFFLCGLCDLCVKFLLGSNFRHYYRF